MFYQNMLYMGFYAVWVLYFVVFVLFLNNILKEGTSTGKKRNFGTYITRMYGIALTNVFVALSVVIMPIVGMIAGMGVYWIAMGVLYTLFIHFFYLRMMLWGEILLYRTEEGKQEQGEEVKEVKGSKNLRIVYIVMVVIVFLYFLVVPFNAFDILPLQSTFFPPIMPLYYHILLDFVILLVLFLLSAITLYVVKKRLESTK